jgi:hypothetical protein
MTGRDDYEFGPTHGLTVGGHYIGGFAIGRRKKDKRQPKKDNKMPHPCPHHCPKPGGGMAAVAVLVAAATITSVAGWVAANAAVIVAVFAAIAVVSVAVTAAGVRYLYRHHTAQLAPWLITPASNKELAGQRLALPARAPLAIEAPKPVLDGTVVTSREQVTRRP